MLRKFVLALASLAIVAGGSASADPAKSTPESTIVAKADESSAASTPATPAAAPTAAETTTEPAVAPAVQAPAAPATTEPSAPVTTAKATDAPADAAVTSDKPTVAAEPAPPPEPTLDVSIDLGAQRISVSEHGEVKHTWPISSGTREFATPRGTFRPQWTAKMWYSRKYDYAPMPHAVFIHGGVAIHATYATGMLGRPASHGCIRLAPANAKTFYNLVQRHGLKMTKVSVYGTPKWGAPAIARRKTPAQYAAVSTSSGGWWWESSPAPSYRATSAYDPAFMKKRKIRRAGQVYTYSNGSPSYYYKKSRGPRVVYRAAPRRAYSGYSAY